MVEKPKNVVLTGTASGLGKYLHLRYPDSYVIKTKTFEKDIEAISDVDIDLIIHCAFDPNIFIDSYSNYLKTNVLYTEKLINSLKPKKFIYISSINVYSEENSDYQLTKLISENIVKKEIEDYLILRCSALTGPTMRESSVGSIVKIFRNENPKIRLTSDSTFNYILQSDIFDFVEFSFKNQIHGTFNFVSSNRISLGEIENRYKKPVSFGNYTYKTPFISNDKLKEVFPQTDRTSEEVLDIIYKGIDNV